MSVTDTEGAKNRRKMPSRMDIFDYWNGRDVFHIHRKPDDDPFGCLLITRPGTKTPIIGCFACGRPDTVRAHILARAEGGSDHVDNLHMLCGGCHTDSELLSGGPYWNWIFGIRRRSFADHYAIRSGYPDFRHLYAAIVVSVLDGCALSITDVSEVLISSVINRHIETSSLHGLEDDTITRRLNSIGLDPGLSAAFSKCRSSRAGCRLDLQVRNTIHDLTVTSGSVRSGNAPKRQRKKKQARTVSEMEKEARAAQRQKTIDSIALEYGHILLEMEGSPLRKIASHLDEIEAPSPFGRDRWTALAVKTLTARYLELI